MKVSKQKSFFMDGIPYPYKCLGEIVLAVAKKYQSEYPQTTYAKFKKILPQRTMNDEVNKYPTILSHDKFLNLKNKDRKRFINNTLLDSNGMEIHVSNQWTNDERPARHNMKTFISIVQEILGYNIVII